MKIATIIYNLSAGGAERVLVTLAKAWHQQGYQVTVITLDTTQSDFYTLPTGVNHIALGVAGESQGFWQAIANNRRRIKKLRETIASVGPDVIVSFMDQTNVLTLLACRHLKIPVVVTEHIDPAFYKIGRVWSCLRRLTYPRAAKVVGVSAGVNAYFKWLPENKRVIIYNSLPLDSGNTHPGLALNPDRKYLVGVGRLTYQKGFDILIDVFSELAPKHPHWNLVILGDGPDRGKLSAQINRLGLSQRILLPGNIQNPSSLLKQCDIFAFPSRFEGFGIVLIEALACGLPVVSFDCPSGPAEIIRNGISGILVPHQDINAMKKALSDLMADESNRKRLAAKAIESVEQFRFDKIIKQWERLIDEVTQNA